MLVLDHVGKTYPNGVHALKGISLTVAPGEILVVIGGSGCGKSTMLRAISGLDTPSQGTASLDGAAITAPREEIGIIGPGVELARPHAAAKLGVPEQELRYGDGRFSVGDRSVGFVELARSLAGTKPHPFDTTAEGVFGTTYPNGCHIAEVEIDPETGRAAIERAAEARIVLTPANAG